MVAIVAAELSTPVTEIEGWPPEKTVDYAAAAIRWLNQKNGAGSVDENRTHSELEAELAGALGLED